MNDIELIPLGKLRLSEANVRKNDSNLFIEELAANIEAKGLLQNLIVVPAKKRGMFDVTAGGRRLRALNFLLEAGKLDIALGDVVTSQIRTRAGQTITLVHDTNTPRPYSRKVLIQGSRGLLEKYPTPRIYIEGKGRADEWQNLFPDWAKEWEHPLWRDLEQKARGAGHGGMDFVMNYRLMDCLQKGLPPDMDVYDAAALSAVTELSERSIAGRSRSVDFPDFTRGRWRSTPPLAVVS